MLMTQNFSYLKATPPHLACVGRGQVGEMVLKLVKLFKIKTTKKKYLFGEASVPIQFTVIICKQDCSTVLGLEFNKVRYHSLSSQSFE